MNGFYTCLLGNAVTILAMTQSTSVAAIALVVAAALLILAERWHMHRMMAHAQELERLRELRETQREAAETAREARS